MYYKFFQNSKCEYFPCHNISDNEQEQFSCLFCYCPLYQYLDCGGNYSLLNSSIKDCSKCNLPHYDYDYIIAKMIARKGLHMNIPIKKVNENATIPTRGSEHAAGYDLYACLEGQVRIRPGGLWKIPTGLSVAIPNGYAGMIYARSGLASKMGLRPCNCVGVVDADYRGEVIVALYNDGYDWAAVKHGDRIAQLVIQPVMNIDFNETESLDETERGTGGFGSTGE